jgi:serine/threonine-protein kinase
VHKEPELSKLPAEAPGRVRDLIGRCLQKDAQRRLQSIGDARVLLQEWLEHPAEEKAVAPAAKGWRRYAPWAAALAAGALGLAVGATAARRASRSAEPPRRLEVAVADNKFFVGVGSSVAFSPDGRNLALVVENGAATQLFLRPLDRLQSLELAAGTGTASPYQPFFSPDGEWVGNVTSSSRRCRSRAGPPSRCARSSGAGAPAGVPVETS